MPFFSQPRRGSSCRGRLVADLQELADLGIPAPMPATSSKVLIGQRRLQGVTWMMGYDVINYDLDKILF